MNRTELTNAKGQEVALLTQHWGDRSLGTENARRVTVEDGPFERRWNRGAKAYELVHGQGKLWRVSWDYEGYSITGEERRMHVESRELIGPWTEHEAERDQKRERRRGPHEAVERLEAAAAAWEVEVKLQLDPLGIDWQPHRKPGADTVTIPVKVVEQLLEAIGAD